MTRSKRSTTTRLLPRLAAIAGLAAPLGCQHPPAAPASPADQAVHADSPGPTTAVEPEGVPGSITVLRPLLPPDPGTWRFDPKGRFIAATFEHGCGLWNIDDGYFGGWLAEGVDADPCVRWPQMQRYDDWEARGPVRGTLHASFDGGRLRVEDGGELRFEQRCPSCRFVGAAIDRDGSRVAAAWIGDHRELGIRVFASDDGHELANLPLEPDHEIEPSRRLLDIDLAWGERLIAMLEVDPWACMPEDQGGYPEDCAKAPPFTVGVWAWTELSAAPDFEPFYEEEGNIRKASWVDPGERFWWLVVGQEEPREGVSWYLHPLALDASRTRLRWVEQGDEEFDDYVHADTQRRWLPGPHVRWATADLGWGLGDWWLTWAVVEASPSPVAQSYDLYEAGLPVEPSWSFHDGGYPRGADPNEERQVIVELEGCLDASRAEERDELMEMYGLDSPCMSYGTAADGCEIVAASATHGVALLRCQDQLRIADIGDSEGSPKLGAALTRGRSTGWVWSPAGLLVAGERGELTLWSVDGRSSRALPAELGAVTQIHEPALGKDLGLALVEVADGAGPVVLDLASGTIRARINATTRVAHAALSPDAKLLALSDGRSISVFELDAPEAALATWTPGKVSGLAFRQDGAVLLSGSERPLPEYAWDPRTGEARDEQRPSDALLLRLAAGDLEPSWRWSAQDDGWIVRTLDGRELWATDGAALLDNGLLAGEPQLVDLRLRVGPEATDPVFEADELAGLLAYPNLLEAFFGGAPLEGPVLSDADIAATLAARPRRAEDPDSWRGW